MSKQIYILSFSLLYFFVLFSSGESGQQLDSRAAPFVAKSCRFVQKNSQVDLSFLDDGDTFGRSKLDSLFTKQSFDRDPYQFILALMNRIKAVEDNQIMEDVNAQEQREQYKALESEHAKLKEEQEKVMMLFRGHKNNVFARIVDMENRLTAMYTAKTAELHEMYIKRTQELQKQIADLDNQILQSIGSMSEDIRGEIESLKGVLGSLETKVSVLMKKQKEKKRQARDDVGKLLQQKFALKAKGTFVSKKITARKKKETSR